DHRAGPRAFEQLAAIDKVRATETPGAVSCGIRVDVRATNPVPGVGGQSRLVHPEDTGADADHPESHSHYAAEPLTVSTGTGTAAFRPDRRSWPGEGRRCHASPGGRPRRDSSAFRWRTPCRIPAGQA